jgi:hypothetical protein
MNRRRMIAAAVAGAVLAGLAWLGANCTDQDSTTQTAAATEPSISSPPVAPVATATGSANGPVSDPAMPAEQSEVGARMTAVRLLELTEDVVALSPSEAAELQRSISTDDAADRLAAEVFEQLSVIQREVPGGVLVEVAPLGVSATRRGDGWDVSVWYVEVIVYADQLAVEQWRTATYTLVWQHDQWLMSGLESVDGPTPTRSASVLSSPTQAVAAAVMAMSDEQASR